MSCVTCHVSRVTCHVSHVTGHVSHVTCHMSCVTKYIYFFLEKKVKLVGGGSVIVGATPSSSYRGHKIVLLQLQLIGNTALYVCQPCAIIDLNGFGKGWDCVQIFTK